MPYSLPPHSPNVRLLVRVITPGHLTCSSQDCMAGLHRMSGSKRAGGSGKGSRANAYSSDRSSETSSPTKTLFARGDWRCKICCQINPARCSDCTKCGEVCSAVGEDWAVTCSEGDGAAYIRSCTSSEYGEDSDADPADRPEATIESISGIDFCANSSTLLLHQLELRTLPSFPAYDKQPSSDKNGPCRAYK